MFPGEAEAQEHLCDLGYSSFGKPSPKIAVAWQSHRSSLFSNNSMMPSWCQRLQHAMFPLSEIINQSSGFRMIYAGI